MKNLLLCLIAFALLCSAKKPPQILYLTWMHDPMTTMTIRWQSIDAKDLDSAILYRKKGEKAWSQKEGGRFRLRNAEFYLHTVELDGLEPDGEYEFRLAGRKGEYRFRTLPKRLTRPVKFVVGGDAYFYYHLMCAMNERVAACDPDFVVVGGDIAYTNGRPSYLNRKGWELRRWRTFFKEWKKSMVTSDGRLIPIIPVLGNHDLRHSSLNPKRHELLFFDLFALKDTTYQVIDAGDYLSLFLLDSGHYFNVQGRQTEWLKETLAQRENTPYKIAAYHISAYPSVYSFKRKISKELRQEWSSQFERYHLQIAFEHHNHAYKRTHPLKNEQINPDGVIYMGDGSWGVNPRKPKDLWYLKEKASANAVCVVTLDPEKGRVDALGLEGKAIDTVDIYPAKKGIASNQLSFLEN